MKLIIGVLTNSSMKKTILFFALIPILCGSCKDKTAPETELDSSIPVTLTSIDTNGIDSYVELNATATYLAKTIIKANATGYLSSVNVASNDYVTSGKVLFTLKTRESKALGNTINKIDSSLNFGGDIKVKSTSNGFVNSINVQEGNYVQDGDQLAQINDANSFALVLSLPYELKKYVKVGATFDAFLPDGNAIKTKVSKFMPSVDAVSQTQSVMLKVIGKQDIPENLIVKVRISKSSSSNVISLPKEAVLSDETETNFWIMKMINGNTAVKIPIQKGEETNDKVVILSPVLTKNDQIVLTGNYGVADTIQVKVNKN